MKMELLSVFRNFTMYFLTPFLKDYNTKYRLPLNRVRPCDSRRVRGMIVVSPYELTRDLFVIGHSLTPNTPAPHYYLRNQLTYAVDLLSWIDIAANRNESDFFVHSIMDFTSKT